MWTKLLKVVALCAIIFPLLAPSNPIMIIRCGGGPNAPAQIINTPPCNPACPPGYLCINGQCVNICAYGSYDNCDGCDEIVWDSDYDVCVCVENLGDSEPTQCGCPPFLPLDISLSVCAPLNENSYVPCYNGDLVVELPPFLCNSTGGDSVEVKVLLFVENNACVTIEDSQNCALTNGQNFVLLLADQFNDPDIHAAFCDEDFDAGVMGIDTIELVFKRDPASETLLDFGDLGEYTIPACPPSAFDPCSCSNANIYNADGTVQYWADTIVVMIPFFGDYLELTANNIPAGFLSPGTFMPFTVSSTWEDGASGDADGAENGTIRIAYFRTPGSALDITLGLNDDPGTGFEGILPFTSTCDLAVTACIVNPIPTLGQWGLMVLGLCLLITGVLAYRSGYYKTFSNKLNLF